MKLKVPTALAPLRIDALNSNIRLPEMKLSRIECTVQLFGADAPLKEYGTTYGDMRVNSYVAAPDEPAKFFIRLKTVGYIATGLAMYVFIDGRFQCNRVKTAIRMPAADVPPRQSEADFVVRGKEHFQRNGLVACQEWWFHGLDANDDDGNDGNDQQAPPGPSAVPEDAIGTIRVVVLRCALTRQSLQPLSSMDFLGARPDLKGKEQKLKSGKTFNYHSLLGKPSPFGRDGGRDKPDPHQPGPKDGPSQWHERFAKNSRSIRDGTLPYVMSVEDKSSKQHWEPVGLGGLSNLFAAAALSPSYSNDEDKGKQSASEPMKDKPASKQSPGTGDAIEATHHIRPAGRLEHSNPLCTPTYMDSGDHPYATFIFRYRSKAALESSLNISFEQEEKLKRYKGMSKKELIEELLSGSQDKDEAPAWDADQTNDNTNWDSGAADNANDGNGNNAWGSASNAGADDRNQPSQNGNWETDTFTGKRRGSKQGKSSREANGRKPQVNWGRSSPPKAQDNNWNGSQQGGNTNWGSPQKSNQGSGSGSRKDEWNAGPLDNTGWDAEASGQNDDKVNEPWGRDDQPQQSNWDNDNDNNAYGVWAGNDEPQQQSSRNGDRGRTIRGGRGGGNGPPWAPWRREPPSPENHMKGWDDQDGNAPGNGASSSRDDRRGNGENRSRHRPSTSDQEPYW